MKVAITGAAGFLGARLSRELLRTGSLGVAGAAPRVIEELLLIDRVPVPEVRRADARVVHLTGELDATLADGSLRGADVVFHLAAVVSGEAERDFDLGMRVNLDLSRRLFEECRRQAVPPVLVFASSLAVFGRGREPGGDGPPFTVFDETLPTPLNSYGVQKFVCEQLLADYTRRGYVRGRSVRLMTVTVRPGPPNAAASGFMSGIVREPLAGGRAVCPVPPDTELAVSSPRRSIEGLLRAATASDDEWGAPTAVNLPPLTVTPRQMLDAMDRVVGGTPSALVEWAHEPAVAAVVTTWPSRFRAERAAALGLFPDPDFETIVRAYLDDE